MVNKVRVNIAGTPYAIATTDPEKYILSLAKKLDEAEKEAGAEYGKEETNEE